MTSNNSIAHSYPINVYDRFNRCIHDENEIADGNSCCNNDVPSDVSLLVDDEDSDDDANNGDDDDESVGDDGSMLLDDDDDDTNR
jgi:hypothetical protein